MHFRIDDKLQVKITDSALSRDLFPDDYCCLYDNENRPVKWLAIETLLHKQFTAASDLVSNFFFNLHQVQVQKIRINRSRACKGLFDISFKTMWANNLDISIS